MKEKKTQKSSNLNKIRRPEAARLSVDSGYLLGEFEELHNRLLWKSSLRIAPNNDARSPAFFQKQRRKSKSQQ